MDAVFYIGFMICAVLAGIFDFLFYRIPNLFVIAIIGLFFIMLPVAGSDHFNLFPLAIGGVTLIICIIFHICGWLGAGDVKFITVTSLWAAKVNFLAFLLSTALAGGILALAYITLSVHIDTIRLFLISTAEQMFRNNAFFKIYNDEPFIYATTFPKAKRKVPYGVAIMVGCLFIGFLALFEGVTS